MKKYQKTLTDYDQNFSNFSLKMKNNLKSERVKVYVIMQNYSNCVQSNTLLLKKYKEKYCKLNEKIPYKKIFIIKKWRKFFIDECAKGKCNHLNKIECFKENEIELEKAIEEEKNYNKNKERWL